MHLATHGFFLPDQQTGPGGSARIKQAVASEDPLLRSGILLAGANTLGGQPAPNVDSGWVTAEDIMGMDLRGTELVVWSGCDTGLGDIQTGEGVFGLRRAFLYAGARSLVVSLYGVPDDETMHLMSHFYESLKAGAGKLNALHDAQLAVISEKRQKTGVAHHFLLGQFYSDW